MGLTVHQKNSNSILPFHLMYFAYIKEQLLTGLQNYAVQFSAQTQQVSLLWD